MPPRCQDDRKKALKDSASMGLDLVILENVGNLVCPAEFDTGAALNLVILSIPEGDDKPLKYPLMFKVAHGGGLQQDGYLLGLRLRFAKAEDHITKLNPNASISPQRQKGRWDGCVSRLYR
jgi:hydrogenase nickel incorporation protein HypB